MSNNSFITKQQFAYDAIKSAIDNGAYPPGAKLVISRIAKTLSVSDIPVREALKLLEAEGLVVNKPHVGFEATMPDFRNALEMLQVRQMLEGEATYLGAKNMTPELLASIRATLDEMNLPSTSKVKAGQLNREFHQAIYAACGNSFLLTILGQVRAKTSRAQSVYVLVPGQLETALREHEEIYDAIARGDAEEARRLLLAHKAHSYSLLASSIA